MNASEQPSNLVTSVTRPKFELPQSMAAAVYGWKCAHVDGPNTFSTSIRSFLSNFVPIRCGDCNFLLLRGRDTILYSIVMYVYIQ